MMSTFFTPLGELMLLSRKLQAGENLSYAAGFANDWLTPPRYDVDRQLKLTELDM